MPRHQLMVLAQRQVESVVSIIRRDPSVFIFDFCKTLDQHDQLNPIKPFPRKEYIARLIEIWLRENLVLIAKSRQMTISWLMIALHLWLGMFFPGKFIFFQSKKEEDADKLLDRAMLIYNHLPSWLQVPHKRKYCMLQFPSINSQIQAVSQSSDAIRSQTASAIFSDEMAFQPYARDAYRGSKPTIDGGGKFTAVSTANGKNFFYNLLMDLEEVA